MTYTPPPLDTPSKVSIVDPSLGRLELGDRPFVVESFQIGSPTIRDNVKNRALMDGEFDDTLYHGSSAITVTARLAPHVRCDPNLPDYGFGQLRDTLVAYCRPRLRPRLYWRYPGDEVGRWAEVRGAAWPFVVAGPKYPTLSVSFKNPLGQMYHGDPEAAANTATAFPGADAEGRTYDMIPDRDYPDVTTPAGTAIVTNVGNSPAGWKLEVHGPFDAGATVTLNGIQIEMNEALLVNEYVTFQTINKTILRNNGLSYYPNTNFGDWDWDDLLLPGKSLASDGVSTMNFDGVDGGSPSGWATIEWYSTSI